MLANALTQHSDVASFGWSNDAELDAARLLAGEPTPKFLPNAEKRYCFQTTYLNEQVGEYLEHANSIYLIWLIRNPHSVVYSMVHNWKRFALNEVFLACGVDLLDPPNAKRLKRYGILGVPAIYRAAYAYLGKLEQAKMLLENMPSDRLALCRYEEVVTRKPEMLRKLFEFCDLTVSSDDAGREISGRSLQKANALNARSKQLVDSLCQRAYEEFIANSSLLTAD